jgi:hypothetical protein
MGHLLKSTMAISNELSSEIAAAIFDKKKTPQELQKLKDVILRVHSTLQEMSEDARIRRAKDRMKESPRLTSSD